MTMRPQETDTEQLQRYAALRTMLEERRREIQEKMRSLRESLPEESAIVRDTEEQSVNDFVRDVDFALMQMKSETLLKIDDSLHRLEQGRYGVCTDCGGEIPQARLQALPFADRCRQCQEKYEAQIADDRMDTPAVGTRLQDALALTVEREARNE
jgi:DnaK suppressor protein